MTKRKTILLMVMIGLAACSPSGRKASRLTANKTAATEKAPAGHTPRPVQNVGTEGFWHGYPCNWDCSVHQAGYAWASEHKIANPKDCRGPSRSFVEGCLAYTGEDGPFEQKEIFQDED